MPLIQGPLDRRGNARARRWAPIRGRYTDAVNEELARFLYSITYQPTGVVTGAMIAPLDTLITSLKTSGYWAICDAIYIHGLFSSQAALLNLKDPSLYPLANNGCTHTAGLGLKGDGASTWFQGPNWAAYPKYLRDDAHFMQWINGGTDAAADKYALGQLSGTARLAFRPRSSGGRVLAHTNCTTASDYGASATAYGCWTVTRTGSAAVEAYRNGVSVGTDTDVSVGIPTTELTGFRLSSTYADFQSPLLCVGGKVDAATQLAAYNAFSTFFTEAGITP